MALSSRAVDTVRDQVKQLLRNELLQKPAQAGDWVRLALTDALSYSAEADGGGPDGAVQFDDSVLKVNPGLKAAVDTLKGINKQVKKTTECTLADVIAYADAEAIEASGGPRIQVHIGRYDGVNVDGAAQPHFSWTGLDQPAALAAAFQARGWSSGGVPEGPRGRLHQTHHCGRKTHGR